MPTSTMCVCGNNQQLADSGDNVFLPHADGGRPCPGIPATDHPTIRKRLQITLKSGAQVVVDFDDFSSSRSPIDGALTTLSWKTPADYTAKLHTIEPSEIAAVVVLREAPQ